MATSRTSHQRQMRRRKNVNPHFKNFVENTSFYGVKYILDGNRHWMERYFWCIVIIGYIYSLFVIYMMKISDWRENSMTIELSNTPQHISTLAIPALTICGPIRMSAGNIRSILNKLHGNEIYQIADILGMSKKAFLHIEQQMFGEIISNVNGTDSNGEKFVMTDLGLETFFGDISVHDYLYLTKSFGSVSERPTSMFRGVCLSFNLLPHSKIYKINAVRNAFHNDIEPKTKKKYGLNIMYHSDTETIHGFPSFTGYYWTSNGTDASSVPFKTPDMVERSSDMNYLLNYDEDLRKTNDIRFIGRDNTTRFAIHNPWDVPSPFMRWHRLQSSTSSRIFIEPELIITGTDPVYDDDVLHKFPFIKRCYNTTEKTLDFFQYYTQQNCLMECSTNRALRECGCVLFYMPHNESTYICSDEYSSCAVNVAKATYYDTGKRRFQDFCDCLPSCNHTEYKVISYESSSSESSQKYKIEIEFRSDVLYPKVRIYTSTDFYLDLFLGGSIMSIVEMFFYILLYVIDHLQRKIQRMLDWLYMS